MLKPLGQVSNRSSDLRIDGITLAARRRCMMRLIENEEASGSKGSEPISQRTRISCIDQKAMRDQES